MVAYTASAEARVGPEKPSQGQVSPTLSNMGEGGREKQGREPSAVSLPWP